MVTRKASFGVALELVSDNPAAGVNIDAKHRYLTGFPWVVMLSDRIGQASGFFRARCGLFFWRSEDCHRGRSEVPGLGFSFR